MDPEDLCEIIDRSPMSAFQWRMVAIMVGLSVLDGFDVPSVSFASPAIVKAWKLAPAALGIVLSMELVGMAIGSLTLGSVAARTGRRAMILACLIVMAAGMFSAAAAGNLVTLRIFRVLMGLDIGGMPAAINAAVAEAPNSALRSLCIVLMAAGYPLGTGVGGSVSSLLLAYLDWPAIFVFGVS